MLKAESLCVHTHTHAHTRWAGAVSGRAETWAVSVGFQPANSPAPPHPSQVINKSPVVGSQRSGFHCTVCTGDTGHVENFESAAVNGVEGEGAGGGAGGELLFSFR